MTVTNNELVGLDVALAEVLKFHTSFGHPVADKPTMLTPERAAKRSGWTVDEVQREFLEAETLEDQVDAIMDGIYFQLGTLVEMGIVHPQALFNIIQNANMAKLHADGKPRYFADGKVMKPIGWVAPEALLKAEIQRHK